MGKVRCLVCGVVLESKHVHDFVQCDCENHTFVDGGNEYLRIGGKDVKKIAIFGKDPLPCEDYDSSKKNIYLAGPIANCTKEDIHGWREKVKEKLKEKFNFFDPTRRIYYDNEKHEEIVEGDKKDIDQCDIILISHIKPSNGTAMEQIYSWERKKHVVFVSNGPMQYVSPWCIYHSNVQFETIEEAIKHLEEYNEGS